MAYDRYDTRDEQSRWSNDDRNSGRGWRGEEGNRGRDGGGRGGQDDRGFFERAGDEIASWFGDDRDDRNQRHDHRMRDERDRSRPSNSQDRDYDRGYGRDRDRDRSGGPGHYGDWNDNRGAFARGGSSERDYNRGWRNEFSGSGSADRSRDRGRDYRPMAGDYGREDHSSDQFFAASGVGRSEQDRDRDRERSQSPWGRDDYRRTSRAGTSDQSDRSRHEDPHYSSWRDRHMGELDRDYDDYRREHQSKFESDFGSWREKRQQKRGVLGQVREHMDVVGNDESHVGKVDKVAGDRIILTKSDPESGGVHHSLSCSDIDRVEGDRVILDCSADQAKKRWRDESRSRALFERDDQGEMGPRVLDRSFEGTYR
jgi:hypothetical protein